MTPALRAIVDRARAVYPFRARGPWEGEKQYLAALIEHVKDRDFSMAYELIFGRPQAQWTPDDIATFRRFMFDGHRPPREDVRGDVLIVDGGSYEVSDASLDALARAGLRAYVARKCEAGNDDGAPILANVLCTDGRLLIASMSRGDRVAVVTRLAREHPVGFFVFADVFIHSAPTEGHTGTSHKREALICHLGTRDRRVMMTRPYTAVDGRVVFDDPPPADIDKRGPETKSDPWAGVFALPTHRTKQ